DVPRTLCTGVERRRDPPLPPPAVSRPSPVASARPHAAVPGGCPSRPGPGGTLLHPDRQSGLLVLHDTRPPPALRLAGAPGSLARRPRGTDASRDPGAEPWPEDLPR